jgi:ABC-type multidrug transport system fused ATPase/permease subunit
MKLLNDFWLLLDYKKRRTFIFIIFLVIIQTFLEMLGIAVIIPFVSYLLNPNLIENFFFLNNFLFSINLDDNSNLIFFVCSFFFLIFLIKNIFLIIINKISLHFIYSFRRELYLNILNKILHQDYLFFVNKGLGKIFNTIFNEVNIYTTFIVTSLITIISEILVAFGILVLIFILGYAKGIIFILPVIIFSGVILKQINKRIKYWANLRIEKNEALLKTSFNLMGGIKEILIFGKINKILKSYDFSLVALKNIDIKNSIIATYPKVLLEQIVILIFILIIIIMNLLKISNSQILITISFFLAAAYRLVPSMNKIFISKQRIKFGIPSYQQISEYYNLDKKIFFIDNDDKNNLNFKNEISFKNIEFSYDSKKKIIDNVNLSIKKFDIIGIYGRSGSGKSTFVNVITSILKLNSGSITVDNKKILNLEDFRRYINLFCLTSQDSFLLEGTIKENIIFGSNEKKIDNGKLNQAIMFAQLTQMVNELELGVDSDIGSSFKTISSGQKQRLSIARAFYSDREILIFDEATNALDENNEKNIIKNISNLNNKTIIIISHNLKNLKICNKIYEFKNGSLLNIKF